MRHLALLVCISLAGAHAAVAGPYDPPLQLALDADAVATLGAGEAVTGYEKANSAAWGAVEIAAPPATVIAAIMDFEARKAEQSSLHGLSRYEESAGTVGVRWVATVMGAEWVFHVRYTLDRGAGVVTYQLDPNQQNDLTFNQGIYQVIPTAAGSRLLFRGRMETGTSVPGWLKSYLAADSTSSQLMGLKRRSEASFRK